MGRSLLPSRFFNDDARLQAFSKDPSAVGTQGSYKGTAELYHFAPLLEEKIRALPGFLDVTGNYSQLAGGTLSLEIAGRDANLPEFDKLRARRAENVIPAA